MLIIMLLKFSKLKYKNNHSGYKKIQTMLSENGCSKFQE